MVPIRALGSIVVLGVAIAACGDGSEQTSSTSGTADPDDAAATVEHDPTVLRDDDVPDLPFDDNPDPTKCGIPVQWGDGDPAWLTGLWEGDLIQPDVLLYDSHQRLRVTGQGAHGAEVRIVLYQENPVLDFYMVEVVDGSGDEGWVPAPFVSFDPVA